MHGETHLRPCLKYYMVAKEPGGPEEPLPLPPAGALRGAVRSRRRRRPPVGKGQARRDECPAPGRRKRIPERLPRPGPATGARVGAEPVHPAQLEAMVILVMPPEHLLRLLFVLFDNGQEDPTLIQAGTRPCGPVEELKHGLSQIVLLPRQFDGEVGDLAGRGLTAIRAAVRRFRPGWPERASFADNERGFFLLILHTSHGNAVHAAAGGIDLFLSEAGQGRGDCGNRFPGEQT